MTDRERRTDRSIQGAVLLVGLLLVVAVLAIALMTGGIR